MPGNCKRTGSDIRERGRYNKKEQEDEAYRKLLLFVMTEELAA
jgi:hypothetical protein